MTQRFACLDFHGGHFRVCSIYTRDGGSSNSLPFITRVINDEPFTSLHFAQMFDRGRVRDTVPHRFPVAFEICERVGVGLSLE